MSTIAEAAAAALEEARARAAELEQQMRDTLVGIVCQTIATRLAPLDATTLTVVHVDLDDWLAVLTDGAVYLAGTDDGRVLLVEDHDGWTPTSEDLRSLAHLGEVLSRRTQEGVHG